MWHACVVLGCLGRWYHLVIYRKSHIINWYNLCSIIRYIQSFQLSNIILTCGNVNDICFGTAVVCYSVPNNKEKIHINKENLRSFRLIKYFCCCCSLYRLVWKKSVILNVLLLVVLNNLNRIARNWSNICWEMEMRFLFIFKFWPLFFHPRIFWRNMWRCSNTPPIYLR
jgi:hypothetical protein